MQFFLEFLERYSFMCKTEVAVQLVCDKHNGNNWRSCCATLQLFVRIEVIMLANHRFTHIIIK